MPCVCLCTINVWLRSEVSVYIFVALIKFVKGNLFIKVVLLFFFEEEGGLLGKYELLVCLFVLILKWFYIRIIFLTYLVFSLLFSSLSPSLFLFNRRNLLHRFLHLGYSFLGLLSF